MKPGSPAGWAPEEVQLSRRRQVAIGAVTSALMMTLGVVFLGFAGRSVVQAVQSADWPTTSGVVESQGVERGRVVVRYRYEVGDRSLVARRVGFDVFDGPGGRGRRETLLARYPVGAEVLVYTRPGHPEEAVLETGDVAPFALPSLFGTMFAALGAWGFVRTARFAQGRPVVTDPEALGRGMVAAVRVLFSAAIGISLLDGAVQETLVRAFGPVLPPGVPVWAAVGTVVVLWFGPFLIGVPRLLGLARSGVPMSLTAMCGIAWRGGPQATDARWASASLLWVLLGGMAWGVFAAWQGV